MADDQGLGVESGTVLWWGQNRTGSIVEASTARWVARSIGILSIALLAGALAFKFANRGAVLPEVSDSWTLSSVFDELAHMGVPILGIIIASRRRENPLGWMFLAAGLALGLAAFGRAYALHALLVDPGSLPGGRAFAWLSNWIWPIPICLLPFLFLLFPTGTLPSRRWRPVAWLSGADLILLTGAALARATTAWSRPFTDLTVAVGSAVGSAANVVLVVRFFGLNLALLLSFAAVAVRFRRSAGDERLQLKWFVTAGALIALTFVLTIFTNTVVGSTLFDLALLFVYAAIGIAMLKYRLYDIDVIIGKTVVYGGLAAFITAVYVLVVAVIGAAIGATEGLALIATAIVAVAFQPVRAKVQAFANRLVYGVRATPYEVLSEFSERVAGAYSIDDVLPRMARILADGTGASRTEVWLRVGSELRLAASWPEDGVDAAPIAIVGDGVPKFDLPSRVAATSTVAPVRHQSELLGALTVTKPSSEPLAPAEEALISNLASQAGLVLRNASLLVDLRASRQRLVAAQDEERRRLERNLHDGAQQQLVALMVQLRLADSMVGKDSEKEHELLTRLQSETNEALDNLRDLARGIYPPLLADKGLAAALEAQARKVSVPVSVDPDGVGRYPQEIEAAVYFCCLEALQNVGKYAGASRASIRLFANDRNLTFEVEDDGVGFDPSSTGYGTGLQGIADRLAALGGSFEVRSTPGLGTTLVGRVPAKLRGYGT
jgi:signal transduction histidine kinase